MTTRLSVRCAVFLLGAVATGATWADWPTAKLGWARYQTHAQTSDIASVGLPPGADASIGSANTALFTFEWRPFHPQVGVELVGGIPPTIKGYGAGSLAPLGEVVSVRNVSPVLFFNYHFGTDKLRPYVGAGVGWTRFVDIRSPYGWDVRLSDAWGPAVQAGVDYEFDDRWGAYAAIGAVKVKTDMVAKAGPAELRATIDLRPIVYTFGLSYKFGLPRPR